MKPASTIPLVALAAVLVGPCFLSSCASNAELEQRMQKRTDAYKSFQERREIRQDARDERDRAWFDRVLN